MLFAQAGMDYAALCHLVDQDGIEGALMRLCDAGVYLSVAEQKGLQPVRRPGLEFQVTPADLANPFFRGRAFTMLSSGSTGQATASGVDFSYARDESLYLALSMDAHGVFERPAAQLSVPLPAPLYYAKMGRPLQKFFSVQGAAGWADFRALTQPKLLVLATQLMRGRYTNPEISGRDQTARAAEWLARQKSRGTPAVIATFPSPAVRLCRAARERGLDISGSVMRLAGEPYTPAKARIIAEAGVRAIVVYVTVETGVVGVSCATPAAADDVHLFGDRLAVVRRPKTVGAGTTVDSLLFTSVSPRTPRLLLNAESGDYADVEDRGCGCLLGDIGLLTHISTIRSYEKLTSEGVTFLGSRLHDLLEEVLPRCFGGSGVDYQLAEEEEDGLARASVVVSPSVGPVDERAVIAKVVETLRSQDPVWSGLWQQHDTLRVVRREPYRTRTAKVLPLHRATGQGRPARAQ